MVEKGQSAERFISYRGPQRIEILKMIEADYSTSRERTAGTHAQRLRAEMAEALRPSPQRLGGVLNLEYEAA